MPDQKVHGNKATLTNLKGPLSGIVNIHLNRNVTVKDNHNKPLTLTQ